MGSMDGEKEREAVRWSNGEKEQWAISIWTALHPGPELKHSFIFCDPDLWFIANHLAVDHSLTLNDRDLECFISQPKRSDFLTSFSHQAAVPAIRETQGFKEDIEIIPLRKRR